MAYHSVIGAGLGSAYSSLPGSSQVPPSIAQMQAQAQSIGDSSKSQAIAFAQQQLQNYPTAYQVQQKYEEYSKYLKAVPNFKPSDMKDPAKAAALMKQALIAYAKANGYPTTTKEAETALAEYAASAALSEIGLPVPAHWPSNLRDLKSVAVDLACTAVIMETGIDPKIITVTVDALMDGKLTMDECTAIGTVAGAIAGAAIGQAFGIPAPIGAFIGGLAGGMVGGTVGQIFGLYDPQEEVRQIQAAFDKFATRTLDQARGICNQARHAYWMAFDKLLLATEMQWEASEVQIGWKFGLRWFGVEAYTQLGQSFSHQWDGTKKRFVGPETYANRAEVFSSHGTLTCAASGPCVHDTERVYGCKYDYGCPYPVAPGILAPAGYERDVQAFLARGALWIPADQRNYQCSFRLPPDVAAFDGGVQRRWVESIQTDLKREQMAVTALQMLSVTVIGDLVKTSAAVQAEKLINDIVTASRDKLSTAKLQRAFALSQAKITGKNLSDLLNYGSFLLGAGLLGAALLKRKS